MSSRITSVALFGVATVSKLPMERTFWATLPYHPTLLAALVLDTPEAQERIGAFLNRRG